MKHAIAHRRSERGFTLTELLVVIAILGVLAGVVVFAVGGIGDKGQSNACETDKATVETAQETHYAKNDAYAGDTDALVKAKLLKAPSKWYETSDTGEVTAIKGNPGKCT